jgi:hypothetical protein
VTELKERNFQLLEKIKLDKVPKIPQPSLPKDDLLKIEAAHLTMLLSVNARTRWNILDKEVYVIPVCWVNKWRAYALSEEKHNSSIDVPTENCNKAKEPPGQIQAQSLLVDSKEFFHNHAFPNSPMNKVLRDSLEEKKDYIVVSKDVGEYLYKIYDGQPIIRNRILTSYNGKYKLDIKLEKVFLL